MGFFDSLSAFMQAAARTTAKQRADAARKFEREHPNMDAETRRKFDEFNRETDRLADFGGAYVTSSASSASAASGSSACDRTETKFMGKSVEQWDREWVSIGMLKTADLSPYNHCVGLYRHVISGTTMYVGRAIELNNGGFRKRLSDYRRESNSARKHSSGRTIYEHLDEIETYILVVGNNFEAVEATRKLEGQFVRKYNPQWNRQINI